MTNILTMPEALRTKEKPPGTEEVLTVLHRFNQIEEKSRCVRVRFLDWLSAKLAGWSMQVQQVSNGIHSPCVIRIGEKT